MLRYLSALYIFTYVYSLEKRTRRISRYSYYLETLANLQWIRKTISCYVTALPMVVREKHILNNKFYCISVYIRWPAALTRINGMYYTFTYHVNAKNITDANEYCRGLGQRLLYIDSQEKKKDVDEMKGMHVFCCLLCIYIVFVVFVAYKF